jgi:hypothetical protein
MEIYLGVASFVHILRRLDRDVSLSGSFYIMLWMPSGGFYQFSISAEDRESTDCGYIAVSKEVLKDMFNKSDYEVIMNTCMRYFNKADRTIAHCSGKGSLDITTTMNGRTFRCLFR